MTFANGKHIHVVVRSNGIKGLEATAGGYLYLARLKRENSVGGVGEMDKLSADNNIYEPTPYEFKLLQVLADPANWDLNVTDRCAKAGVSRRLYYQAMSKPGFIEVYNKYMDDALRGHVNAIIEATYKFAVKDAKNHQDRRLLLEMAGTYAAKTKTEVTTPEGLAAALTVTFAKSEDE